VRGDNFFSCFTIYSRNLIALAAEESVETSVLREIRMIARKRKLEQLSCATTRAIDRLLGFEVDCERHNGDPNTMSCTGAVFREIVSLTMKIKDVLGDVAAYPLSCCQRYTGPCTSKRTFSANHDVQIFDSRRLIRCNFAVYLITEV
jgi:hypothetical protein